MTLRPLRSLIGAREGSGVVEFALVAPVLLMLIFGVIEFARLMWTVEALQETAATGARCMALPQASCASAGSYSAATTRSYIEQLASQWGVALQDGDITLDANASCGGTAGFSQVSITSTFNSVVPEIVGLFGKALSATSCFPNPS